MAGARELEGIGKDDPRLQQLLEEHRGRNGGMLRVGFGGRGVRIIFSPTSRIRRRFWAFCDFLVAQLSDLFGYCFVKVARIGCSEDLVPSPGRVLMYWSAPGRFCRTGTGNDRGTSPISGSPRMWNNCAPCSEDFFT